MKSEYSLWLTSVKNIPATHFEKKSTLNAEQ